MTQLFDPASHTFWRNVKERAVAPVTAFGRNPARWDVWEPAAVPPVPTWCAAALTNLLAVPWRRCFTAFCLVTRHCCVPCDLVHMVHCVLHQKPRTALHDKLQCMLPAHCYMACSIIGCLVASARRVAACMLLSPCDTASRMSWRILLCCNMLHWMLSCQGVNI